MPKAEIFGDDHFPDGILRRRSGVEYDVEGFGRIGGDLLGRENETKNNEDEDDKEDERHIIQRKSPYRQFLQ